jgi:hypothetical protein
MEVGMPLEHFLIVMTSIIGGVVALRGPERRLVLRS